ncbi:MAG: hemolysin III family protein [Pseudomonadota bacterium]
MHTQTLKEEIINTVIHGVGFLFAMAALILMIVYASLTKELMLIASTTVFGISLVFLYYSSSLYHAFSLTNAKYVFRKIDHFNIYILIAGTYTPFALSVVGGAWGWTLFGIEWGLVVAGIAWKSYFGYRYDFYATMGYAVMGWMMIIVIKPLLANFNYWGIFWLFGGGVFYTLGIPFFLLDTKHKYFHNIWHVFVLAGSVCHFLSVFLYIIP